MAELPGVPLITGAGSGKSSLHPLHTPIARQPPEQPWSIFTPPEIGQAVALTILRAGCTRFTLINMSTPGLQKNLFLIR